MDDMTRGDLRERITIERETIVENDSGGSDGAWAPHLTRWAQVKPVKGREDVDAGRTASIETFLIVMRWDRQLAEVTASDRINLSGRILNITTAQNRDMKRRWITIEAEAGIAQ